MPIQSVVLLGKIMSRLMRLSIAILSLGAGAALVGLPSGCSRKTPSGPTTVTGRVTFLGNPLANGLIVFTPDADRGGSGKPARGDLDSDGRFQLKLAGETAILPGWYRVSIAPQWQVASHSSARLSFPPQLARPDKSGVIREVKAGQQNVFEFDVEVPNT